MMNPYSLQLFSHVYLLLFLIVQEATKKRKLDGEIPIVPLEERQFEEMMCTINDPIIDEVAKESIFDPPTADEMEQVMSAMMLFDFGDESEAVVLSKQFGPIELAMQPLPGPDREAISELFSGQSLATTALSSPGPIWGGIQTNYIARIELIPPIKAEATAYLFGDGPMPGTWLCAFCFARRCCSIKLISSSLTFFLRALCSRQC